MPNPNIRRAIMSRGAPQELNHIMLCVQGSDLWIQANSKTYIDNLISEIDGYITDIAVLCYYPAGINRPVLGESTLCYETTVSINGKKPLTYLCEQATIRGIKVWAWFVFMYASNWCGTSSMLLDPIPDTSDYRVAGVEGYIIRYDVESSRTKIAAAVIDFAQQNPGIAGIILDYIRTDGLTSQNASDITLLVKKIHDDMPTGIKLGFWSLANTAAFSSNKQDGKTWVDNRYVDFVATMNYEGGWWDRWDCARDFVAVPIYVGVSSVGSESSASGYLARMNAYRLRGFYNLFDFQWSSSGMWDAPNNFLDAIKDYKGWITSTMANVTSLSVDWQSGGSYSFVIGGTTRTVYYDDVTDHTTDQTMKNHVEELYGDLPYLFFYPGSGYFFLELGDVSERIR